MRDAFGGTAMMYLLLIFLFLYTVFMAIALNYAKAFRVKNKVIDIIEQNEGIRDTGFSDISEESVLGTINSYLDSVNYYVSDIDKEKYGPVCYDRGYCISKNTATVDGLNSEYYQITTFVKLDFPFMDLKIVVPIRGETRKIDLINRS